MPSRAPVCLLAAVGFVLGAEGRSSAEEASSQELLEQARGAMKRRHIPAESARALALYEKAIEAGGGYESLWEGARAAADRGRTRMPRARTREKRAVFKKGIDWARRAVKIRPGGAEGHLYLALTVGHDAETRSFLHQMGIAGEVRRAAERAIQLDASVECGTALRVLGMYYVRLPDSLGGDDSRGLKLIQRAVRICPNKPAAHMDLAEALEANGQRARAVEELEWVLAHPPRRAVDRAGYRTTKATAEKLLKRWR